MLLEHQRLERELGPIPKTKPAEGLITLKQAVALPELGGVISIKSLRSAIGRGDIAAVQPAGPGGAVYVTKPAVLAWIQKCHVNPNHHASTFVPPATVTARSARTQRGSSSMAGRKSALAAALKIAAELKKR